eukprot:comp21322_c0_seq1/m.29197 comp21322_c0_seq1/g.29197  ORF comp21322_c0_seq1/g.29197 comp21322_c0_seq1/m.29197 type:complete len:234 (-) comp21322_c0_seq1:1152-1853(-)
MSLSVVGLKCSLPGGRVLFQGLNFEVEKGEALVIRGPSGAGKTHLLRLLAQLDAQDEGTITLNGEHTPESLGTPAWRTRVFYVAQDAPLLPGSPNDLFKQITSFRAQKGRQVGNPVDVGTEWFLSPDAFDKRWSDLSGGERQRAALAIAVALRPEVLLLDESTSSLDPVATEAVEKTLRSGTFTTIWVSHNQSQTDRVATRVLQLAEFAPGNGKQPSDEIVAIEDGPGPARSK